MLNPDFLSAFFVIISIIIFIIIEGFFVKIAVKRVIQWNKNNNSPVITVKARIIGKRIKVSGNNTFIHHSSPITIYYVAF